MNYPHPILAREGWPFIAGALVIALLASYAGVWSLPFWVILDSTGKVLEDSRVNGENLGGPASEEEVNHLITKLEKTTKNDRVDPEKIKEVFILKKK